MKIHHVGYIIKDMEKSRIQFEKLGYSPVYGDVTYDPIRGINILFMSNDSIVIELIQPAEKDSAVGDLLKKTGPSPYHICYLVPSMEEAIKELTALKYILTVPPEKAPALENKQVAFLYHRHVGIVELLEE